MSDAGQIDRLIHLWELGLSDAASVLGMSEEEVTRWRASGVPASHRHAVDDLTAATQVLKQYVAAERMASVVRRPSAALGDRSLLDLALEGRHEEVRLAVEAMFDLRRAQP